MTARVWPPGSTTGIGSLPGTDSVEAARLILGEVPDLPYLPELPARGLGADLIGRAGALLIDFALEWQPHGWTATSQGGSDLRQARDFLHRDLDAITELGQGIELLKIQVCGPVSMAVGVELPNLHKVLTDHGAFRDLADSLAEGVRAQIAELQARLPGTRIVLQVDEPSLPAALAGRIPTPSGYGTVRALQGSVAGAALSAVLGAAAEGSRVVHCCAQEPPLRLFRSAGADAVALDASLIRAEDLDQIGEIIDDGAAIWLGVVPALDAPITLDGTRQTVLNFWKRLGFARTELADTVVLTPACGMAGASPAHVRRVMAVLRDAGAAIRESED
jgi:methionine synthase II (cobalamin-independent)